MPSYLVETFLPRSRAEERAARDEQVRTAAAATGTEGAAVRFDRSLHVLEDEICFYVFAAPTAADAEVVARRAGLDPIRVLEARSDDLSRKGER